MKPNRVRYRSHSAYFKSWSVTKKEWKNWIKATYKYYGSKEKSRAQLLIDKIEVIPAHINSRRLEKQKWQKEINCED